MLHVHLDALDILSDDGDHNAFTDCAYWRHRYWVAFRKAVSHNITPPGIIEIHTMTDEAWHTWDWTETLTLYGTFGKTQTTDIRDPRFLVTEEALYCFVGVYQPAPLRQELAEDSAANSIRTYVTHTKDGRHWTPLTPILRAGHWGWSSAYNAQQGLLFVAAYYTGAHGEPSSITLWSGTSAYTLRPHATIYDGAALFEADAPHFYPSEPYLFPLESRLLGCCVRSEAGVDIGVGRPPYQTADWRWRKTTARVHISGSVLTPYGRFMVGRELPPQTLLSKATHNTASPTVALWRLTGEGLEHYHTFPSYGDCAYAGITATAHPGTYLVSYYSQSKPRPKSLTLPGAAVYVATITLTLDSH